MLPADVYARFLRARGRRRAASSARPTSTARRPSSRRSRPGRTSPSSAGPAPGSGGSARAGFDLSFDHFGRSSSPQNHELTKHFARRLEEHGLIEVRTTQQIYSQRRRPLPAGPLRRSAPVRIAATIARAAISARTARACSIRSISSSRARHLGQRRRRGPREPRICSSSSPRSRRSCAPGSTRTDGLAVRDDVHRLQVAGRRAAGPRHHARSRMGRAGRLGPAFEDKVFYVWFDAPIEYIGATKEWADVDPASAMTGDRWWYGDARATSPTRSSWARTMCRSTRSCFPSRSWARASRGSWSICLKGFNWLTYYGGKFSTSRKRGVFMDPSARAAAGRLLALLPDGQRAGVG